MSFSIFVIDLVDSPISLFFPNHPLTVPVTFVQTPDLLTTTTVNISFKQLIPPKYLYHGTAQRFINSINEQGLIPKDRQYVHLTENKDTALSVGMRYGKPKLLVIDALKMHNNGFEFFQAENNVWLVKHVPVKFITFQ